LGTAPFNPFIFIDGDRGKEVHLPGYAPTTLVNKKYFGTYHDNTNGKDVFYKTLNNLPYAINIPETLEYPLERQSIHYGYLKFAYWAQSGGTIFTDWYKDIEGYRKAGYLYSK
jgi:LruC domain-containing protein